MWLQSLPVPALPQPIDCACSQEMDLVIEEDFLDIISSLIRELPFGDIYQHDAPQTSQSFLSKEDPLQVSGPVLCACCLVRLGVTSLAA